MFQKSLDYHEFPKPGKLEINITTPFKTQEDLSLAYSPGVANPCLEIEKNPQDAFRYTAKKNLVAVMSNGTAVLGLGDIGALASKPVMEGKAILFKGFANIDSFDIEIDKYDVDGFCDVAKAIAPTFGGINLEDIKSPECFEIEERLVNELDIPVMHDDQHGTAIISGAGLLNACEITNRDISQIKVVIMGAAGSAISCGNIYKELGVKNIIMCDSKGVISKKSKNLNKYKETFALDDDMSIEDAFKDADMVLGLSRAGSIKPEYIALMKDEPIVFTLANPTPEIMPDVTLKIKSDAITATGRSDFKNQINNVLGFPYIFRGALDVQATKINMQMKLGAVYALANLAKEKVPQYVCDIYKDENLVFGKDYIIPKPFDKRLYHIISGAVAKAAVESGVANVSDFDYDKYTQKLQKEKS